VALEETLKIIRLPKQLQRTFSSNKFWRKKIANVRKPPKVKNYKNNHFEGNIKEPIEKVIWNQNNEIPESLKKKRRYFFSKFIKKNGK